MGGRVDKYIGMRMNNIIYFYLKKIMELKVVLIEYG